MGWFNYVECSDTSDPNKSCGMSTGPILGNAFCWRKFKMIMNKLKKVFSKVVEEKPDLDLVWRHFEGIFPRQKFCSDAQTSRHPDIGQKNKIRKCPPVSDLSPSVPDTLIAVWMMARRGPTALQLKDSDKTSEIWERPGQLCSVVFIMKILEGQLKGLQLLIPVDSKTTSNFSKVAE